MAIESVTLPIEAIKDIRRMLLVGLHAFGEVDRVQTEAHAAKQIGIKVEQDLIPIMLTSTYETPNFAEALTGWNTPNLWKRMRGRNERATSTPFDG